MPQNNSNTSPGNNQQRGLTLEEKAIQAQRESEQKLAGAAFVDPAAVLQLPEVQGLDPEALVDLRVRAFWEGLLAKRGDLLAVDTDGQIAIAGEVASAAGCLFDVTGWIPFDEQPESAGRAAALDIQRKIILREEGRGVAKTSSEITLEDLLENAITSRNGGRKSALESLAGALLDCSFATVLDYGQRLAAARVCSKGEFEKIWKESKKSRPVGQYTVDGQLVAAAPGREAKLPIPTDDDLRDRWIAAHPLTSYGIGEFRRYKDGVWPALPLSGVRTEIDQVLVTAKRDGVRPTARLLNSVAELARVKLEIAPERWDADSDYLVCKNCVLHIPTRTTLSHSPEFYATSGLDFDYDPGAVASRWEYVLNYCVPDAKDFLQEFAGLCLTPETGHEIAVWLHSLPGGGKSTILAGLQSMLGKRAGLLGLADIEKSRFALTDLPGKTLVVSAEQPSSFISATHVLNALISGEPLTVDRKFREPVTIVPRAKLIWAMNDLPRVADAGSGLFRRVKVIRLPQIPESERDPGLKEGIKQEGAGILNWALEGLARLRARGRFDIPACVREATAHFQETNDVPAAFVAEKCFTGNDPSGKPYRAQGSLLYSAYRTWCADNGHKPQGSTGIGEDWRRLGFEKTLINGLSFWKGVGLKE